MHTIPLEDPVANWVLLTAMERRELAEEEEREIEDDPGEARKSIEENDPSCSAAYIGSEESNARYEGVILLIPLAVGNMEVCVPEGTSQSRRVPSRAAERIERPGPMMAVAVTRRVWARRVRAGSGDDVIASLSAGRIWTEKSEDALRRTREDGKNWSEVSVDL